MRKCEFLSGKSKCSMLESNGQLPYLTVYVQLEKLAKFYYEINRNIIFKHFGMFSQYLAHSRTQL